MNDTDATGPLPVLPGEEPPHGQAGWIPAVEPSAVEPSVAVRTTSELSTTGELAPLPGDGRLTGADPDLPWDFATEPAPEQSGTPADRLVPDGATTVLPVIPPLEDDPPPPAGTPPKTPATRSRHGQPAPLSRAWNRGVAAAIAIAAVLVGIYAANHASNSPKPAPNGAGPAFVLPTTGLATTGGTVSATSPPALAAIPKVSSTAVPSTGASGASAVPADAPSVTVLNQTATHGLAATEADRLRSAGWTVRRVTNVSAHLTETTVFYDPGQQAAAKALVASVASVKVALPRPKYLLATGGLIVVVASDAA